MNNFTIFGSIDNIDIAKELVLHEDFSRRTMRELLENQKNTRIVVGLFDILDGVDGFADIDVLRKYYSIVYDATIKVKEYYGYKHIKYRTLNIIKLMANSIISEHIDESGAYDKCHRIHIPIVTSELCKFKVGGEEYSMKEGEIVEINNLLVHSVENKGDDRIHIIFDIEETDEEYEFDIASISNSIPEQFYTKEK